MFELTEYQLSQSAITLQSFAIECYISYRLNTDVLLPLKSTRVISKKKGYHGAIIMKIALHHR
jgi:hypothetical protein